MQGPSDTSKGPRRLRITVEGTVQGVGFRPFVHRLASRLGLTGTVCNASEGVTLEVEGALEATQAFLDALPAQAPPLARVRSVHAEPIPPTGTVGFRVVASRRSAAASARRVLVPPDVATCAACLEELNDDADRRHRYPFINCTDCGPRFTIIEDLPYDRPLTTMRGFELCPDCRAEYEEISDRRYHAQPVACPRCGPGIWLVDAAGKTVNSDDVMLRAVQRLQAGQIGAIKGLGGFHLACDAACAEAVDTLRRRKRRPDKPFAVMALDLEAVRRFARPTQREVELLQSWRRPIVLLQARGDTPLAAPVNGTSGWVGAMLPYTPLHQLLLQEGDYPALVMTSGNLSDEPIVCDNDLALTKLRDIADFFLLHDRPILNRADDSVVAVMPSAVGHTPTMIRRSRGYVPEPISLPRGGAPVVAVGGDLKNTCCVTRGELAILSQHIGDLEQWEATELLRDALERLTRLHGVDPALVVHDLHPDYHSTRLAHELQLPRLALQHHHAHALSCLAEHGCAEPALAIVLDGTGHGTDGAVWGGEVLAVDGLSFERLAHLRYLPLPGGDMAAREPWRMALAALTAHHGERLPERMRRLPPFTAAEPGFVEGVLTLALLPAACPQTSSAGRLFDAVASLLDRRQVSTFEGQAAMELEQLAREAASLPWSAGRAREICTGQQDVTALPWTLDGDVIDMVPAVVELAEAVLAGEDPSELAWRFHASLAGALVVVAAQMARRTGIGQIALSGGSLQNRILHRLLVDGLESAGLRVMAHRRVPPNDGGLSLGQAWAGVLQLQ